MAHVGKYVDWRLIVTAPFDEDVELFVTDLDSSLYSILNPTDKYVGSRLRMRRLMLDMSQSDLADGPRADIPAGPEV